MTMTALTARVSARPHQSAAASRVSSAFHKAWPPLLVAIGVVILWEVLVNALGVASYVIAKPSEIAAEMVASAAMLWDSTLVTTYEIVWGFLISVVVGVLIAVLVVRFAWLERAVYPLIVLFQVVPKVALAPIFILWFGYDLTPKLILIVVMAFFPVTINMVLGLKRADEDLILLMRSVGSSRNAIMARVQIPTSLPYLFAGLRVGITLAVIGAVVAEFSGAQAGLGYLIQFASTQLDTALMFAALIIVSVLGLLMYYAVGLIEFVLKSTLYPHLATPMD
jgi:NitT/TauT family transport system permease protein